jgi:hypothetical protein
MGRLLWLVDAPSSRVVITSKPFVFIIARQLSICTFYLQFYIHNTWENTFICVYNSSVWASYGNLSSAPWKIAGCLHHMTVDLGSLRGHAGPCILHLSGHKICPVRTLTSLHPQVPGFIRYLCSLIPPPNLMAASHSLDRTSLHSVPCPTHPYTFSLSFFSRPPEPRLFRAIKTPVLVSYWFARW